MQILDTIKTIEKSYRKAGKSITKKQVLTLANYLEEHYGE